jgi:hypothetical protein
MIPAASIAHSLSASKQWAFLTVFVYSALMMFVYRRFMLPLFEERSRDGLIPGDPMLYHQLAIDLANKVATDGWSAWLLRPEGQAPAGILALVYLVAGPDPWAIIPLNAALHAGAATALLGIALRYAPAPLALLACLPFWLSPYYMMWFSQPNKDSFTSLGSIMLVGGFVAIAGAKSLSRQKDYVDWSMGLAWVLAGAFVNAIVRPYLANVTVVAGMVAAVVMLALIVKQGGVRERISSIAYRLLALAVILAAVFLFGRAATHEAPNNVDKALLFAFEHPSQISWKRTEWMPKTLDYAVYAVVVSQRDSFRPLKDDPNPTSRETLIDLDHRFKSATDAMRYTARALQIGLFAPFPTLWSLFGVPSNSVFRNMVTFEMILAYISYLLLLWAVVANRRKAELAVGATVAITFVLAYAFATPHLGILDRFRYPFLTCLVVLGVAPALGAWQRQRLSRVRALGDQDSERA